jgi:beta-glucosidase/6-phospho-beta-glucosidase/beta-galactosidase
MNTALFAGHGAAPWGAVCVGAALAVLPLMLMFAVASRRLIEGLSVGAVTCERFKPCAIHQSPAHPASDSAADRSAAENAFTGFVSGFMDPVFRGQTPVSMLDLRAVAQARQAGVGAPGFFYWSLQDNCEWDAGYDQRFGLVHMDDATPVRTLKDSAHWCRDTIAALRERGGHG